MQTSAKQHKRTQACLVPNLENSKGLGYYRPVPTVVEEQGFRIKVNTRDHMPPHVHAWKAGKVARFIVWDGTVSLYENHGMSERDLQTAGELCVKHYDAIEAKLRKMPWVK
jgi:hypothetical protein